MLTEQIVRQCPDAGVSRVWMHQSLMMAGTSVSQEAVEFCREHDIADVAAGSDIGVIAGACPMMYCEPVDFGHKCMRWVLCLIGDLPK